MKTKKVLKETDKNKKKKAIKECNSNKSNTCQEKKNQETLTHISDQKGVQETFQEPIEIPQMPACNLYYDFELKKLKNLTKVRSNKFKFRLLNRLYVISFHM